MMRHLEATMLVCDKNNMIELDGTGNVLLLDGVRGIGSGGLFAECKFWDVIFRCRFGLDGHRGPFRGGYRPESNENS